MTDYWQGVLTPFVVVGVLVVAAGMVWLVAVVLPEVTWWTVKRLPLHDAWVRDRAAAVVGAARRAYVLRIPVGVRVVLALGGDRDAQDEVLGRLRRGRLSGADVPENVS